MYQWGHFTHEQWIRVLFIEGMFHIADAQTFLDIHAGRQTREIRRPNPANRFTGAVVATMLIFGPAPDRTQIHYLTQFSNAHPNMRYMSSYQWALTRHILTKTITAARVLLYVLNNPWWDYPGSQNHNIQGAQATQNQAENQQEAADTTPVDPAPNNEVRP